MIRPNKQRGTAMVEFALILPVFLLLAVGGLDMLYATYTYGQLGYVSEQVANCRANYYAYNGAPPPGTLGSNCVNNPPSDFANAVASSMAMEAQGATNFTAAADVAPTPATPYVQESVTYPYSPFSGLIPSFSMTGAASATVSPVYSTTITVGAGYPLLANNCVEFLPAGALANVTPQMAAVASPQTAPDTFITYYALVDPAGNQVDLYLCSLNGATATVLPTTYNVRVIP